MNLILLTSGMSGHLAVHQLNHHIGTARHSSPGVVHLLILDARRMDPPCFDAACAEIANIKKTYGLNHGVLLCHAPTLPLTVAAIRCGLRDVIYQVIDAQRLRSLLQAAYPGGRLTLKEFNAIGTVLRSLGGTATAESPQADLARREHELERKAEQLASLETKLAFERDTLTNRDRDLRDRTRRLERQLALQQNDADVGPAQPSTPPFSDLQLLSQKLEQKAAELDFREKMLIEMQAVLTAAGLPPPSSDK